MHGRVRRPYRNALAASAFACSLAGADPRKMHGMHTVVFCTPQRGIPPRSPHFFNQPVDRHAG